MGGRIRFNGHRFFDNHLVMRHLYQNFLHDPKVWHLNAAYYRRLVKSVTKTEPTSFFQTSFGNGKKIQDDHIFSTKFNDRILQVIQREASSEQPFLKAWLKKWDGETDMLVITLELSDEIKPVLEVVVANWLNGKLSAEEMKDYVGRLGLEKHFEN